MTADPFLPRAGVFFNSLHYSARTVCACARVHVCLCVMHVCVRVPVATAGYFYRDTSRIVSPFKGTRARRRQERRECSIVDDD